MVEFESPLMRVSEVSKSILRENPAATYAKIANQVFPPGVVIKLGERSYRFHKQKLLAWLESGGTAGNSGNHSDESRTAQVA